MYWEYNNKVCVHKKSSAQSRSTTSRGKAIAQASSRPHGLGPSQHLKAGRVNRFDFRLGRLQVAIPQALRQGLLLPVSHFSWRLPLPPRCCHRIVLSPPHSITTSFCHNLVQAHGPLRADRHPVKTLIQDIYLRGGQLLVKLHLEPPRMLGKAWKRPSYLSIYAQGWG